MIRFMSMVVAVALGCSMASAAEPALRDVVQLGTLAALAPLCGVRDEAWAFDLRRATIQEATKAPPDDKALKAAPGSDQLVAALSYAEDEALEDFAEAPAPRTCVPLARDSGLARADAMVKAFRELKAQAKPSS